MFGVNKYAANISLLEFFSMAFPMDSLFAHCFQTMDIPSTLIATDFWALIWHDLHIKHNHKLSEQIIRVSSRITCVHFPWSHGACKPRLHLIKRSDRAIQTVLLNHSFLNLISHLSCMYSTSDQPSCCRRKLFQ